MSDPGIHIDPTDPASLPDEWPDMSDEGLAAATVHMPAIPDGAHSNIGEDHRADRPKAPSPLDWDGVGEDPAAAALRAEDETRTADQDGGQ
jgi:hypothetical protein